MSRDGRIELSFGTDEHLFRLGIGQWREVQEACDAGPPEILARLRPLFAALRQGLTFEQAMDVGLLGRWRIDDVRAPILHGLVGGGMREEEAGRLVRKVFDPRPAMEFVDLAYQIVMAGLVGAEDEKAVGELEGETASPLSPEESSASDKTASTP